MGVTYGKVIRKYIRSNMMEFVKQNWNSNVHDKETLPLHGQLLLFWWWGRNCCLVSKGLTLETDELALLIVFIHFKTSHAPCEPTLLTMFLKAAQNKSSENHHVVHLLFHLQLWTINFKEQMFTRMFKCAVFYCVFWEAQHRAFKKLHLHICIMFIFNITKHSVYLPIT